MISIIAKFGASIKCLKISRTRLAMSTFLEILSLVPNLEHLVIESLQLQDEKSLKQRKISSDNDLNLHQLKKLRYQGNVVGRDAILAVFDRLPVGELTELDLICFELNAVVVLFKRQTNIVKLEVTEFIFTVSDRFDIFDSLTLQSLVISSYSSPDIAIFLSNQTQLKSLTIPHAEAKEDLLNFVANHFTKLETLSINMSRAPSALCKANISNIKSLKDLSVGFGVEELAATSQLESLAEYPYFGITSLFLYHNLLNVNLVQALAKSLTKLKALKLYCYNQGNSDNDIHTIISAVMANFNFVEVLHIRGKINGHYHLNNGDYFNPKLTELIAPLPNCASTSTICLNKLIADYPNLKKLQIDWNLITSLQFRAILNGCTKLESLTFIDCAERLTEDDLNYVKDHKNNLKFISLGGLKSQFTDELKIRLSATFGVLICNNYSLRIMAVDRHTLNRERRSKEKGLGGGDFS